MMVRVYLVAVFFILSVLVLADGSCYSQREMENTICSLCSQRVNNVCRDIGGTQVAFHAYMSHNVLISSLSPNKTFVYDRIETNVGNGYDVSTGNFVAPEDGVYAFHVTTVARDNSHCSVELVQNEEVKDIGWADAMDHLDRDTSSTFTILRVKTGDVIRARVGQARGGNLLESNQYARLSFSGFKIV